MKTFVAVAALALLACTMPAQAQGPVGISLEATSAGTVPFMGSGSFAFTLQVGCSELDPEQLEATVTITDSPDWMNFTPEVVELSPAACLNADGRITEEGTLGFTVSAAAPGVVQHVVHLQAHVGETPSDDVPSVTLQVAYESDYSLVPDVTFPLTVTNKTTTFTVVGTQASNAPSMIMVDDFSASAGALVSGIGALQYANEAGSPESKTYTVIFTAPSGDWETASVSLKTFGHYNFDGKAGDPMDHKNVTWEFVNGGVHEHEENGGGKESPAPVAALTALGLLAFAALRRRKA